METVLPENIQNTNLFSNRVPAKEHLYLVEQDNKQFLVKGKRKKERNFLEGLRFENEKRAYKAFRKEKFRHLRVPDFKIEKNNGKLYLEYISSRTDEPVSNEDLVRGYVELQSLTWQKNLWLDLFNQTCRAYFYRVSLVSLITLSRKTSLSLALKVNYLFAMLHLTQPVFSRAFRVHGDLHQDNFFYDEDQHLYMIDFENMFYTYRWPLAEIVSKATEFSEEQEKILFSSDLIIRFLRISGIAQLPEFSLERQVRFGILHHCIHEIAQTKIPQKRKAYIALLERTLDQESFLKWLKDNLSGFRA